jgi:hypothetical protein
MRDEYLTPHKLSPGKARNGTRLLQQSKKVYFLFVILSEEQSMDTSGTAATTQTDSISKRLSVFTSLIRDKLKPGLDKQLQEELVGLLNLIPELDNTYYLPLMPLMEIAVQSLTSENPNIPLAAGIRKGIEKNVHRSPIAAIFGGGSPPARVIRGLGTLLFLLIPVLTILLLIFLSYKDIPDASANFWKYLWLIASVGAVGSVVSIMVRIRDYESLTNSDPTILFLIGFFKPIIGMAFALFVYASLKAGLIPLTVPDVQAPYFYAALAFISGFSERLAKDIVTRTEDNLAPAQPSNH